MQCPSNAGLLIFFSTWHLWELQVQCCHKALKYPGLRGLLSGIMSFLSPACLPVFCILHDGSVRCPSPACFPTSLHLLLLVHTAWAHLSPLQASEAWAGFDDCWQCCVCMLCCSLTFLSLAPPPFLDVDLDSQRVCKHNHWRTNDTAHMFSKGEAILFISYLSKIWEAGNWPKESILMHHLNLWLRTLRYLVRKHQDTVQ